MENLIFLICFTIFSFLTAFVMLLMAYIFSYKKQETVKSQTYECGLIPEHSIRQKYNIKYYDYLILFLVFDVVSVLLYPIFLTEAEYTKSHFGIVFIFLVMIFFIFMYGKESV